MAAPLDELRALRDAETDPTRRAQLDARIARLEAETKTGASAALRLDGSQTGDVTTGDVVGRDKQKVVVQPGASATVATTVHQHHYSPTSVAGATGATAPGLGSFDLRLQHADDQWRVRAVAPGLPPDFPPQPFELPVALDSVAARRGDAASWVAQARVVTRQRPGEQLRLRLHLPPELATRPWELLNDPRGGAEGSYLALDPDVSLVRAIDRPLLAPTPVAGPLHLQLVIASPAGGDYPLLDVAREIRRIEDALRNIFECRFSDAALNTRSPRTPRPFAFAPFAGFVPSRARFSLSLSRPS